MDLMMRRSVLLASGKKKLLPDGYTQIEYVYCDGSQPYIRVTNIQNIPTYVNCKVKEDDGYIGERAFMGRVTGWEIYYQAYHQAAHDMRFWSTGTVAGTKISASFGNSDEIVVQITQWGDAVDYFDLGRYREGQYKYIGKIYEAKLWDENNVVLYHFIPCIRLSDNMVSFYDVASNVFYPSIGDAVFIAGPVV